MTGRARIVSSVALLAFAAIFPPFAQPAPGAPMYTVTDLGALPGYMYTSAVSINNYGQIVGASFNRGVSNRAFLYMGGVMYDMGTLAGHPNSDASDINDAGQVVGNAFAYGDLTFSDYGFLYSGGQMQPLGMLGANAINNAGQIAGKTYDGNLSLFSGGTYSDLGVRVNYVNGINDNGHIVGESSYGDAFLYSGGQLQHLGTLGGPESSASDINNAGVVVGSSYIAGENATHAFQYSGGILQDLGTLPGGPSSAANGVNNEGQIVGTSMAGGGQYGLSYAFLYSGGTMIDLNTLIDPSTGWTLGTANDINDLGQIVGAGYNSAGQQDAFLLTPVPEPATLTLLALGSLAGLGCRHRALARKQ